MPPVPLVVVDDFLDVSARRSFVGRAVFRAPLPKLDRRGRERHPLHRHQSVRGPWVQQARPKMPSEQILRANALWTAGAHARAVRASGVLRTTRGRSPAAYLFACAALGATLSGCYEMHERTDERPAGDAGREAGRDAFVFDGEARRDAFIPPDGWREEDRTGDFDDATAASCEPAGPVLAVRVEAITADEAVCAAMHDDDITITGVEPEPAVDGIRIHADYCNSDRDCRCDLIVSRVGTDVSSSLAVALGLPGRATYGIVLDVVPGDGSGGVPAMISLQRATICDCLGCPCSIQLVLFARSGSPDAAGGPPEMRFSRGDVVCPEISCRSGSWDLHAEGFGGATDVPAGSDRGLGITRTRSLRDVDIFGRCGACATCDTPFGSWISWVLPG